MSLREVVWLWLCIHISVLSALDCSNGCVIYDIGTQYCQSKYAIAPLSSNNSNSGLTKSNNFECIELSNILINQNNNNKNSETNNSMVSMLYLDKSVNIWQSVIISIIVAFVIFSLYSIFKYCCKCCNCLCFKNPKPKVTEIISNPTTNDIEINDKNITTRIRQHSHSNRTMNNNKNKKYTRYHYNPKKDEFYSNDNSSAESDDSSETAVDFFVPNKPPKSMSKSLLSTPKLKNAIRRSNLSESIDNNNNREDSSSNSNNHKKLPQSPRLELLKSRSEDITDVNEVTNNSNSNSNIKSSSIEKSLYHLSSKSKSLNVPNTNYNHNRTKSLNSGSNVTNFSLEPGTNDSRLDVNGNGNGNMNIVDSHSSDMKRSRTPEPRPSNSQSQLRNSGKKSKDSHESQMLPLQTANEIKISSQSNNGTPMFKPSNRNYNMHNSPHKLSVPQQQTQATVNDNNITTPHSNPTEHSISFTVSPMTHASRQSRTNTPVSKSMKGFKSPQSKSKSNIKSPNMKPKTKSKTKPKPHKPKSKTKSKVNKSPNMKPKKSPNMRPKKSPNLSPTKSPNRTSRSPLQRGKSNKTAVHKTPTVKHQSESHNMYEARPNSNSRRGRSRLKGRTTPVPKSKGKGKQHNPIAYANTNTNTDSNTRKASNSSTGSTHKNKHRNSNNSTPFPNSKLDSHLTMESENPNMFAVRINPSFHANDEFNADTNINANSNTNPTNQFESKLKDEQIHLAIDRTNDRKLSNHKARPSMDYDFPSVQWQNNLNNSRHVNTITPHEDFPAIPDNLLIFEDDNISSTPSKSPPKYGRMHRLESDSHSHTGNMNNLSLTQSSNITTPTLYTNQMSNQHMPSNQQRQSNSTSSLHPNFRRIPLTNLNSNRSDITNDSEITLPYPITHNRNSGMSVHSLRSVRSVGSLNDINEELSDNEYDTMALKNLQRSTKDKDGGMIKGRDTIELSYSHSKYLNQLQGFAQL